MRVKFFATYRQITGCKETDLKAQSIGQLLHDVCGRWPGLRPKLLDESGTEIGPDAIVMVDGRNVVHLEGIDTPLTEENVVALFPLVAGG